MPAVDYPHPEISATPISLLERLPLSLFSRQWRHSPQQAASGRSKECDGAFASAFSHLQPLPSASEQGNSREFRWAGHSDGDRAAKRARGEGSTVIERQMVKMRTIQPRLSAEALGPFLNSRLESTRPSCRWAEL